MSQHRCKGFHIFWRSRLLPELRLPPQLRVPLQSAREAALEHFRPRGIGTLAPRAAPGACASAGPTEGKPSQETALGSCGTGPTQRRHDGPATSDLGPRRQRAGLCWRLRPQLCEVLVGCWIPDVGHTVRFSQRLWNPGSKVVSRHLFLRSVH